MRILMIGNFGHGWDGSICDEEHIAQALKDLGNEVVRYQRETANETIDWMQGYDFTLIAQWDGYKDELLSKLPRPLVYWAFDYQNYGQEWHDTLIRNCDLYLSKRLREGFVDDAPFEKWRWLSQDFSPNFLDKLEYQQMPVWPSIDVLFTGTYLPWATERNKTLKAVDEHFDLTIHSLNPEAWMAAGFKNTQGPVMDEALPALIAKTRINLSIDHTIEAGYWSDRNAQIMACGGFVLFRHVPLSETVFRDNIAYFYNTDNCLKQIQYYLDNVTARKMIATNGYQYADEWLRVDNRVSDMLTLVQEIL